jgi:plastocyanin
MQAARRAARGRRATRCRSASRSSRFTGPSKLKKGRNAFTFRNAGKFPHNLTVVAASTGAPRFKSRTLVADKSQTLSVTLKPGAYLAVCTVADGFHFSRGMVKWFTVGTFDTTTGEWK